MSHDQSTIIIPSQGDKNVFFLFNFNQTKKENNFSIQFSR